MGDNHHGDVSSQLEIDHETFSSINDEGSGDPKNAFIAEHQTDSSEIAETCPENEKKCPENEESAQTFSCWRCIRTLPHRNPRTCAVVFGIFLPLCLLIGLSVVGGYYLARFEGPNELFNNDLILANRFSLKFFDYEIAVKELLVLPEICYQEYLNSTYIGESNITLSDFTGPVAYDVEEPALLEALSNAILELKLHMAECSSKVGAALAAFEEAEIQDGISPELAAQELSFNWVRCWNITLFGAHMAFSPSQVQAEAAAFQDDFFQESWKHDRERLYREYLDELGDNHPDSRLEATLRSIADATGSRECIENVSGTAWFWFTVMTTIGRYPVRFALFLVL
jgi:hypothetical protein